MGKFTFYIYIFVSLVGGGAVSNFTSCFSATNDETMDRSTAGNQDIP